MSDASTKASTTEPGDGKVGEDPQRGAASSTSRSTISSGGSATTTDETQNASSLQQQPWQARVRTAVVPYLPPPVVHAMQDVVDPALAPYMGEEASITLATTLILAYLTSQLIRFLYRQGRSGRAIAAEDEDKDRLLSTAKLQQNQAPIDATVLLCGPLSSGKTRLFYQLVYDEAEVETLTSLQANVGLLTIPPAKEKGSSTTIRFVDWPGHASLQDEALKEAVWDQYDASLRMVLMLDATQPVAAAATVLFELLNLLDAKKQSTKNKPTVFVACHKKDLPKSKKWQRCKIQLRTELERIIAVERQKAATEEASAAETQWWWNEEKEQLDLDDLPMAQLRFASTTACEDATGRASDDLLQFCRTGQ